MDFLFKQVLSFDLNMPMSRDHYERTLNVLKFVRITISDPNTLKPSDLITQTNSLEFFGQILSYLVQFLKD